VLTAVILRKDIVLKRIIGDERLSVIGILEEFDHVKQIDNVRTRQILIWLKFGEMDIKRIIYDIACNLKNLQN